MPVILRSPLELDGRCVCILPLGPDGWESTAALYIFAGFNFILVQRVKFDSM